MRNRHRQENEKKKKTKITILESILGLYHRSWKTGITDLQQQQEIFAGR